MGSGEYCRKFHFIQWPTSRNEKRNNWSLPWTETIIKLTTFNIYLCLLKPFRPFASPKVQTVTESELLFWQILAFIQIRLLELFSYRELWLWTYPPPSRVNGGINSWRNQLPYKCVFPSWMSLRNKPRDESTMSAFWNCLIRSLRDRCKSPVVFHAAS